MKSSIGTKIAMVFTGIFILGLLFAAINGVLYLIQDFPDRANKTKIAELDIQVQQLDATLKQTERDLAGEAAAMKAFEQQMKQWRATDEDRYNQNLTRYEQITGDYRRNFDNYEKMLAKRKQLVADYNELVDKVGSSFYLLPFWGSR